MRDVRKWHSIVGVAAIGMFAFSVYGGPRVTRIDGDAKQPAQAQHKVVGYEILHSLGDVPAAAEGRYQAMPTDVPIPIFEVWADGQTGGVAQESYDSAVVYRQNYDSGYFYVWGKHLDIGNMVAQPMNLGNGFDYTAGHQVNGYDLLVYNSVSGFGEAGIDVELWTGDALGWIETGPNWGPIAGTQASWTGLVQGGYDTNGCIGGICDGGYLDGTACTDSSDCGLCPGLRPAAGGYMAEPYDPDSCAPTCAGLYRLRTSFTPVTMYTDQPYMVAYITEGCRLGWRASWYRPPDVGAGYGHVGCAAVPGPCTDFVEEIYEYGQFVCSAGTCCDTGAVCDHCDVATNNDCAHPTFCSSGAVTHAGGWYYGAPTYYASFVATVYAPMGPVIQVVPRSDDAGCSVEPNGFLCMNGADGGHFWFDFNVSNWDPEHDASPQIKTWQIKIDPSGYGFDMAGFLTPWNAPCTTNADCTAAMGTGSVCNDPGYPPGGCSPGFMNFGLDPNCPGSANGCLTLDLPAASISTLAFVFGSTIVFGPPADDVGNVAYAGTVVLTAAGGAMGTAEVLLNPAGTYLKDMANQPIPLTGMIPAYVTVPTGQCCDLSAQPFVCVSDCMTKAECEGLGYVWTYGKTCDDDCGCLTNDQCDDGDACTTDICNAAQQCENNDNFPTDGSVCCDPATGTTCTVDDGEQCTVDSCELANYRGDCLNVSSVIPCDDENQCTYNDVCDGLDPPTCAGSDVNTVPCTTSIDCEAVTGVAFDCVGGFCLCVLEPPLTFVKVDPPPMNCYEEGDKIEVYIFLGAAANVINGAQFTVYFDETCMTLDSIEPAGPPYVFEIMELVLGPGEVFYAVGVDPLGGVGTNGNANLALLTFTKVGECNSCTLNLGGVNPYNIMLTDDDGQPVGAIPEESKPVYDLDELWIDVPDDVAVNVDCDMVTAEVYWDPPEAGGDCYEVNLVCEGWYPDMSPIPQYKVMHGGEFPIGDSTFTCTATSKGCGQSITDQWTVTVNEQTTLDIEVQLSPIIVADDLIRCIEFALYADCVQDPFTFDMELHFGGMWDHVGHFTEAIKIPSAGQWFCITAQDQLHTLRSVAWLECVDGVYSAVFKGDPFFGGNWLINGNLDAFKKENPNASHDVIDILDFGQFVANYLRQMDPNTYCPTHPDEGHADINGDGIVNGLDFAFIMQNFLMMSKDACCPGSVATEPTPVVSVSVRDLRAMGMPELIVADINGDGVLDVDDMNAFASGQTPGQKKDRLNRGK